MAIGDRCEGGSKSVGTVAEVGQVVCRAVSVGKGAGMHRAADAAHARVGFAVQTAVSGCDARKGLVNGNDLDRPGMRLTVWPGAGAGAGIGMEKVVGIGSRDSVAASLGWWLNKGRMGVAAGLEGRSARDSVPSDTGSVCRRAAAWESVAVSGPYSAAIATLRQHRRKGAWNARTAGSSAKMTHSYAALTVSLPAHHVASRPARVSLLGRAHRSAWMRDPFVP